MWPTILTLTGLVVDIIGAFILAVEAIGVDRVRDWRGRLWGDSWTTPIIGWVVTGAILFWLVRAGLYPLEEWWFRGATAFGILLGVGIAMIGILELTERFMSAAELSTRRRAAGLLGFTLLAAGFALQFAGTLWGALAK